MAQLPVSCTLCVSEILLNVGEEQHTRDGYLLRVEFGILEDKSVGLVGAARRICRQYAGLTLRMCDGAYK